MKVLHQPPFLHFLAQFACPLFDAALQGKIGCFLFALFTPGSVTETYSKRVQGGTHNSREPLHGPDPVAHPLRLFDRGLPLFANCGEGG